MTFRYKMLYFYYEQGTDFILPKWAFSRRQETSVSCSYAERSPFYLKNKMPKGIITSGNFKKGHQINNGRTPWNKGTKGIMKAWNKNKRGYTNNGSFKKGHIPWSKKGRHYSPKSEFQIGHTPWRKYSKAHRKTYLKTYMRNWGHSLKGKLHHKKCSANRKLQTKDLTIKRIQQVYEDNIKLYSTLTCYLCLKPIPFGKDHLEHKIPLSRGGTNEKDNLDIACQHCNLTKNNKTVAEFNALQHLLEK